MRQFLSKRQKGSILHKAPGKLKQNVKKTHLLKEL